MRQVIDGDGSPVKEDVIDLASKKKLEVVIVTSVDHYTTKEYPSNVQLVYVDRGTDSADFKIVGLIHRGDFLVTQDYGLASLVLPKGVRVFHQSGKEFDESNIGSLLEQRYHSGKMRKAGLRTRGPKPFTKEDHAAFRLAFEQALAEK
ncbi:YaiI/YqxD family protein [Bifidobacterium adolescentis]|nr:YaiI/YqxD family protein [Bifidobacterium adolescentis]